MNIENTGVMASLWLWKHILVRGFLMASMAAMLLYCSTIQAWKDWNHNYNCPANCAFGRERGGEPLVWMKVSIVLVAWSYGSHLFSLCIPFQVFWLDNVRHVIVDTQARPDTYRPSKWWQTYTRVLWYFLNSEALHWIQDGLVWFGLGCLWIAQDISDVKRGASSWAPGVWKDESNVFGFGQLVPLFLFLLPFWQIFSSYSGK